jgi:hypothetical protein
MSSPTVASAMSILALSALALTLDACASNDCSSDGDCPAGRVCRVGLCSLAVSGGDSSVLEDVDLGCDPPLPGELVLNEVLADPPPGVDVDGDGNASSTADEFVEVVNVAGRAVALTNVEIRVGDRTVGLGARCLAPFEARVFTGSQGLPGLANNGATVQLIIAGQVAQTMTYGSEGGRDSALVLSPELEPDGVWVLHSAVYTTALSPGTCGGGEPFPDCGAPSPPPDTTSGADVLADLPPAACTEAPRAGDLVINELLADPGTDGTATANDANQDGVVSSDADEFVELVNVSARTLLLDGLALEDAGGKKTAFPGSLCLSPGQALVVFGRYAGGGDFGGSLVVGGTGSLSLNNGGDTVRLLDAGGGVLAEAAWGAEGNQDEALTREVDMDPLSALVRHTTAPGAEGRRMSPGRCKTFGAFPDCGVSAPDPGAEVAGDIGAVDAGADGGGDVGPSCPPPAPGDLLVHELVRAPAGRDFNGDGTADNLQDELVEIVNGTAGPLSLAGLELHDALYARHRFDSACLPAGEAIVVFGGGTPGAAPAGATWVKASGGSLGLNDTGAETVKLQLSDGTVIDSVETSQTGSFAGKAWARQPDCSRLPVAEHPVLGEWQASPGLLTDGRAFSTATCTFPPL